MGPGVGGWLGQAGRASRHTGPPPLSPWKQRPPCQGRKDLWEEENCRAAGFTQMAVCGASPGLWELLPTAV